MAEQGGLREHPVTRRPALIVGAGGTGIKALRLIKLIAECRQDTELLRMLNQQEINLFGIDTDRESFERDKFIDETLLRHLGDGDAEDAWMGPIPLPILDHFIPIDTREIVKARKTVQAELLKAYSGASPPAAAEHSAILDWYPKGTEDGRQIVGLGYDNQAGAGQYRFLGRIGLFLNAGQIYANLQNMVNGLRSACARRKEIPRQAYIVCSLAGGTGSGMFWDLAFMLRDIDEQLQIKGFFLLPGAFEAVDKAGRIRPNTYAALKEMVHYKNWRQPNVFTVRYPIAGAFKQFRAQPGHSIPAFQTIFLFDGFSIPQSGRHTPQHSIDISCLRIAENILACLREDVTELLQTGANNESGDTTVPLSSKESAFVFSTLGTTEFTLQRIGDLRNSVFRYVWSSLLRDASTASITRQELENALRPMLPEGKLGQSLLRDFIDKQEDDLPDKPRQWQAMTNSLAKGIERLSLQLGPEKAQAADVVNTDNTGPFEFDELKSIYVQAVPLVIRNSIEAFYMDKHNDKKPIDRLTMNESHGLGTDELKECDARFMQYITRCKDTLASKSSGFEESVSRYFEDDLAEILVEANTLNALENPFGSVDLGPWTVQASGFFRMVSGKISKRDLSVSPRTYAKALQPILARLQEYFDKFQGFQSSERRGMILKHLRDNAAHYRRQLSDLRNISESKTRESKYRQKKMANLLAERLPTHQLKAEGERLLYVFRYAFQSMKRDFIKDKTYSPVGIQLAKMVRSALLVEPILDEDVEAISDAEKWTIALHTAVRRSAERSAGFLSDLFTELAGPPPSTSVDDDRLEQYLTKLKLVTRAFADYWITHHDLLLASAGGEEGIETRLRDCKNYVFESGPTENTLRKERVVVVPPIIRPGGSAHDISHAADDDFAKAIERIARNTLGPVPVQYATPSAMPIVFYQDLFRSPAEIVSLHHYHQSYTQQPVEVRPYFHLHDGAEKLPDINYGYVDPPKIVLCGNPGCQKDIRRLPRNMVICPECRQPIRNRCGNLDCIADDIVDQLNQRKSNTGKRSQQDIAKECPACSGPLHTYWWTCKTEGHQLRMISTDADICQRCLQDYRRGVISSADIRKRPDLGQEICAGCLTQNIDEAVFTVVPTDLDAYYRDGVAPDAKRSFTASVQDCASGNSRSRIDMHLCGGLGDTHVLFPTCPEGAHDPRLRHHLFRNGDSFVCAKHPHKEFYECFHCGYPVDAKDLSLLRDGTTACPRCLRKVGPCYYCSPRDGKIFEGEAVDDGERFRCPRCRNFITKDSNISESELKSGIKDAAACTNIFECRAGHDLWMTTAEWEHGRGKCKACPKQPASLLAFDMMVEAVNDCPLCQMLIGNKSRETIRRVNMSTAKERFRLLPSDTSVDAFCEVCGTNKQIMRAWLATAFSDSEPPDYVSPRYGMGDAPLGEVKKPATDASRDGGAPRLPVAIPSLRFEDAYEIFDALHRYADDLEAYKTLMRLPKMREVLNHLDQVKHDIMSVCKQERVVSRGLFRRLEGLEDIHKAVINRQ